MNIIKFSSNKKNKSMAFCMIDNTNSIIDTWAKEITKNQADYTISNLYSKGYTIFQGKNEDHLLKVASKNFDYACVFSTGTEFINGEICLVNLEDQCHDNFLIKGHILDRGDAYYELHQQCYLINLKELRNLNYPIIGNQSIGERHIQICPDRSKENIHDDYTPLWISKGNLLKAYNHKCHGWNIISVSLEKYPIYAFTDIVRNNKKHLYPESPKDFYKNLNYVYHKERFCVKQFIHKTHTEYIEPITNLRQIVTPASGEGYRSMLDLNKKCKVIFYDYNLQSLDYYKNNIDKLANVDYEFINCDLLGNFYDLVLHIDKTLEEYTLINFSNIFCYEGTSTLTNTKFRLQKENEYLEHLKNKLPETWIYFSSRASTGFIDDTVHIQRSKELSVYEINDFKTPTWRIVDW